MVLKALLDAVEGLGEGLPRHGLGVAVQQARIEKRLQHHRHAADLVQVVHHAGAAGLEVADLGRPPADCVERPD